jgi:hypothetical protein
MRGSLLFAVFLAYDVSVLGFASVCLHQRWLRQPSLALHAAARSGYDESFIASLCSNLSLQPATEESLRNQRVPENVLFAIDIGGLEQRYNISFYDAVTLSDWSVLRRKQEEEAERARYKQEEEAERARYKHEEEAERARYTQEKIDQRKHVLIFNEANGKYEKMCFSDQNSLQLFISDTRIRGLALVDADDSSTLEVVREWDRLVNGSCYASPDKVLDAVEVLVRDLAKAEKAKAEFGSGRLLSEHLKTKLSYIGSDIRMKDSRGKDIGDIDTLFVSEDHLQVVLLERKHSGSMNESSIANLLGQIHATREAFGQPGTNFSMSIQQGVNYSTNATVRSAVYFNACPTGLLRILREAGILVVLDADQLFANSADNPAAGP